MRPASPQHRRAPCHQGALGRIRAALLTVMMMMTVPANAAEPVLLHSAGSLRSALTELGTAFEATTGVKVQGKFGPSGVLKDEIAGGARAELFTSANMEHPQSLADTKRSGPVVLFARNRLCALVRPGLTVAPGSVLDRMLDADVKLGTSTPLNDPSGDCAWEVFRKADKLKPGAFAVLERKALQLVGGPPAPTTPPGRTIYGMLMAEGKADVFLTYCTNAREAQQEKAALQLVHLPDELAVAADYGLTVIAGASADAYRLAMYILSSEGQRILAKYGFAAPLLRQ
jgi:molybdate transport system substrate-binding protein